MNFLRNRSLSTKILTLFALASIMLPMIIHFTARTPFREHIEHRMNEQAALYLNIIKQELRVPIDTAQTKALADKLGVVITLRDANSEWSSSARPIHHLPNHRLVKRQRDGQVFLTGRNRRGFVMRFYRGTTEITFYTPRTRPQHTPVWKILLTTILWSLSGLLVLYAAIRYLMRPLKPINQGIEKIAQGDLKHRIKLDSGDEFGQLAGRINGMAEEIEGMLEAKRQLLLAISHELRTPITRAKLALSLIDNNNSELQSVDDELTELSQIIDHLMDAERLKDSHQTLNRQSFSLFDSATQQANKHSAVVELVADDAMQNVNWDKMRIELAIKNLLDNAEKYGATTIVLSIKQGPEYTSLCIEDNGQGIEATELEKIKQAFYRVDSHRSREHGGFGLGLYLVQQIVSAHEGELNIESQPGQYTKVCIKLATGV